MELNKDKATILRLDEIRELILNLSLSSNSQAFETLATTIVSRLTVIIDSLKSGLITTTDGEENTNSLEDRLIIKMDEVYQLLNDALLDVSLTAEQIEILNTTLQNTIEIKESLQSSSSAGLTSEQDKKLTQTYDNTVALLDSVGLSENASSIISKLNNLILNTESIMEKLALPNNEFQETEPYDPPPETIYKTRDNYKSLFDYEVVAPTDCFREYFTINTGVNAMCKVEFDVDAEEDVEDVYMKFTLSGTQILHEETLTMTAGSKHFCLYGMFITDRTDYYLHLSFINNGKLFKVYNITYQVLGDNANFIEYKHTYHTYNINFEYYIMRTRDDKVEYIITNAFEPDLSQNYTTFMEGSEYIYYPLLASTVKDATDTMSVNKGMKVIAMDKTTKRASHYNENAEFVYSADHTKAITCRLLATLTTNEDREPVWVYRYDDVTKSLYSNYFNVACTTLMLTSTSKDLSGSDEIINIAGCKPMRSYMQKYFFGDYVVITTKKGNNYATAIQSNKTANSLGYGTRVTVGEVPNYQGIEGSAITEYIMRAFLYVYDHWKVIYFKLSTINFEILGVKTISGEYDELHPGFNGDYFAVKDGQLLKFSDPDVIAVEFNQD